MHIYIYMYTCIYVHMHICIYMYVYMQVRAQQAGPATVHKGIGLTHLVLPPLAAERHGHSGYGCEERHQKGVCLLKET